MLKTFGIAFISLWLTASLLAGPVPAAGISSGDGLQSLQKAYPAEDVLILQSGNFSLLHLQISWHLTTKAEPWINSIYQKDQRGPGGIQMGPRIEVTQQFHSLTVAPPRQCMPMSGTSLLKTTIAHPQFGPIGICIQTSKTSVPGKPAITRADFSTLPGSGLLGQIQIQGSGVDPDEISMILKSLTSLRKRGRI
ncbi:MAG: hypothetical protein ACAI44_20125 [Candidatus Sericytochromatia bacterium]